MKQVLLENFKTRNSKNPIWEYPHMEVIPNDLSVQSPTDDLNMKITKVEYVTRIPIRVAMAGGKIRGDTGEYESNYKELNVYITDEVEKATGIRSCIQSQTKFIDQQHEELCKLIRGRDKMRRCASD